MESNVRHECRCKFPWAWLLLPFLLAGILGALGSQAVSSELLKQSRSRLQTAGISGVSTDFDGQDVVYRGPAELEDKVRSLVLGGDGNAKINGVRHFRYIATSSSVPETEPAATDVASTDALVIETTLPAAPLESKAPVTQADSTAAPETEAVVTEAAATEAPTTEAEAPTTVVVASVTPLDVTARIDAKRLVLSGTVGSDALRSALVAKASEAFGAGNVTDNLTVVGTADDTQAARGERFAALLAVASTDLITGEGRLTDDVVGLSGSARNLTSQARLQGQAMKVAGSVEITIATDPATPGTESDENPLGFTG